MIMSMLPYRAGSLDMRRRSLALALILALAHYAASELEPYTLGKVEDRGQFNEHKLQERIAFNTSVS